MKALYFFFLLTISFKSSYASFFEWRYKATLTPKGGVPQFLNSESSDGILSGEKIPPTGRNLHGAEWSCVISSEKDMWTRTADIDPSLFYETRWIKCNHKLGAETSIDLTCHHNKKTGESLPTERDITLSYSDDKLHITLSCK